MADSDGTTSARGAGRRRGPRAPALSAGLALLVVVWWWAKFVDRGEQADLDSLLYFLPTYAATWERFRAGEIPLWNPYQLCGIPWIATLQGGTFYPSHALYGLLPLHVAVAASGLLHLILAAVATAAFVRRLGLGHTAALLAAVVFVLRGHMAVSLVGPNVPEAIAWLPVGAVALVDLVRRPGPWPVALLAAATGASFLAGYPQPTVYVLYAWGSLFLALLLHQAPGLRGALGRVGAFGAALATGAAIAAIQLLPALELIVIGTRSHEGLDERAMFPSGATLTQALPIIGRHSISGSGFAFGLLVLALAAAAPFAPGRRILGWWAVGVAALAAAFAVGRYLPTFELYLLLPGLRLFRNPARILFVTDFAVAIAAALGLSGVTGRGAVAAPHRRRVAAIAAMALGLGGVVALVGRGWAPRAGALVPAFAAVTFVAMIALLVARTPRWRAAVGWAIAVAAVVEISFNPWFDIRLPYRAADVARYERHAADLRALAALAGSDRVWRVAGIQPEVALKLSTWHRLRTMNDYEPVNLQRQGDYFTFFSEGSTRRTRPPWLFSGDIATFDPPPGGTPLATRRRLLDLAAVRWVVLPAGAQFNRPMRDFVRGAGLRRHPSSGSFAVFENPAALPRAFVTYRVRSAPPAVDTLLSQMSFARFDPHAWSFVEGPPPFEAAGDAPARGHAATIVVDGETEVELEARLARPGLVVLADSYYPGWRATVDGVQAPIVPTNHLFRGVPAPAGTHRIRFTYEPASVGVGAAATFGGLAVVVWLVAAGRRRRPASSPAAHRERAAGAA